MEFQVLFVLKHSYQTFNDALLFVRTHSKAPSDKVAYL